MSLMLRLLAIPFFVAAAGVYVYVHFFSEGNVDCNAFSFLSTLDFGCLMTSATWLVVCLTAAPGIALWVGGIQRRPSPKETTPT